MSVEVDSEVGATRRAVLLARMRPLAVGLGAVAGPVRELTGRARDAADLLAALRRAIDYDPTTLQRRAFIAIALNEVPMDAFARELGVSRNSVYKSLFDARRELRASLDAAATPYIRVVAR